MYIFAILYAAAAIPAVVLTAPVDIENRLKAVDLGLLGAALGAGPSIVIDGRKIFEGPPALPVPNFDEKLKHFNDVATKLSPAAKQAVAEVFDVAMKPGFPPRKALEIGLIMDKQSDDELQTLRDELFPTPPSPKKLILAMLREFMQMIESN